jgi:hypothetical protein
LNYVEPAVYDGIQKTAFYTELSTNFVPGDRVYILNGFYDSDDYIQKDKYTKFTDGYRVLDVNGCRVVLNLDYTGQIPYVDYNQEDLIFVHNITSQERFNYINTLKQQAPPDSEREDDDTLYLNVGKSANDSAGATDLAAGGLALTGGLLSTLGTYALVRKLYQNVKRKQ